MCVFNIQPILLAAIANLTYLCTGKTQFIHSYSWVPTRQNCQNYDALSSVPSLPSNKVLIETIKRARFRKCIPTRVKRFIIITTVWCYLRTACFRSNSSDRRVFFMPVVVVPVAMAWWSRRNIIIILLIWWWRLIHLLLGLTLLIKLYWFWWRPEDYERRWSSIYPGLIWEVLA